MVKQNQGSSSLTRNGIFFLYTILLLIENTLKGILEFFLKKLKI
jgi:hypothetical protein